MEFLISVLRFFGGSGISLTYMNSKMIMITYLTMFDIMSNRILLQSIGGLVRLTLGRKESGHGREVEEPWGALSGMAVNQPPMEIFVIACICPCTLTTLEPILHVNLTCLILFVKYSFDLVSPSTKVEWSYFY